MLYAREDVFADDVPIAEKQSGDFVFVHDLNAPPNAGIKSA